MFNFQSDLQINMDIEEANETKIVQNPDSIANAVFKHLNQKIAKIKGNLNELHI